jgi:hypothetical protein
MLLNDQNATAGILCITPRVYRCKMLAGQRAIPCIPEAVLAYMRRTGTATL